MPGIDAKDENNARNFKTTSLGPEKQGTLPSRLRYRPVTQERLHTNRLPSSCLSWVAVAEFGALEMMTWRASKFAEVLDQVRTEL